MPDTTTDTQSTDTSATDTSKVDDQQQSTDTSATDSKDDGNTGTDTLGDAGKKAIDAMKAAKKEAEAKARAAEQRAAELQAKLDGKDAEHAASVEAQKVKDEAIAAANDRIKKAEVRAAAAGKLADPKDALLHLDLSEFEVSSDGEVDASQIATAIDDLIAAKPYLAAQGGKRFQGTADGGARNDASKPSQLTRDELTRMSPEDIAKAETEGRLDTVLGRK